MVPEWLEYLLTERRTALEEHFRTDDSGALERLRRAEAELADAVAILDEVRRRYEAQPAVAHAEALNGMRAERDRLESLARDQTGMEREGTIASLGAVTARIRALADAVPRAPYPRPPTPAVSPALRDAELQFLRQDLQTDESDLGTRLREVAKARLACHIVPSEYERALASPEDEESRKVLTAIRDRLNPILKPTSPFTEPYEEILEKGATATVQPKGQGQTRKDGNNRHR